MDNLPELVNYANQLEAACFDTLNEGLTSKDLVNLMEGITPKSLTSLEFLRAIRERLEKRLGA
jgi:isocitrate dehydrogenase